MVDAEPSEPQDQEPKIEETRRPFSTLMESMMIKIMRSDELYPEPNLVDWHRPSSTASAPSPLFSTITLTRNGTEDCPVQIAIHLNHFPRRFMINPLLGSFLDLKEASLDEVYESIWCYIKKNKLIDSGVDKRLIRKDSNLACVCLSPLPPFPF
jgi:SWI/SNF-related matrix-associated actin-dependent regulator of chromatin subfamily D